MANFQQNQPQQNHIQQNQLQLMLADESATVAFGGAIASAIKSLGQGISLYLDGELGTGKTTLSRGIVTGLGHQGKVKSPTYTLVEPYELAKWHVYHFDLYRLSDPEELEFMGIRDYFSPQAVCIVEWPERGDGMLPEADLLVELVYVEQQRQITLISRTDKGASILQSLKC